MTKNYIKWRIHRELRIHYTKPPWMRELATPKHTEDYTDVEIECLYPSECHSTFKCRDIKFLSLQVCVWAMPDPQFIDFHGLDFVLE